MTPTTVPCKWDPLQIGVMLMTYPMKLLVFIHRHIYCEGWPCPDVEGWHYHGRSVSRASKDCRGGWGVCAALRVNTVGAM